MKQYDLWWASLPLPAGRRPVLLLSRDSAYTYLSRVLAVEISRRIRGIPQELVLGPADGVPERCAANFDTVRRLSLSWLQVRIGRLHASRYDEVKRTFGHALTWPELTRIADDPYA